MPLLLLRSSSRRPPGGVASSWLPLQGPHGFIASRLGGPNATTAHDQICHKKSLWQPPSCALHRCRCRPDLHHHGFTLPLGHQVRLTALFLPLHIEQVECSSQNDNDYLIRSFCANGQLERAMDALSNTSATIFPTTYMSLLKTCVKRKSLPCVQQVHAHLVQHHTHVPGWVCDYLVLSLAKCGAIEDAKQLSAELPLRTVFSWTAIISAYAGHGSGSDTIRMFQLMLEDGVQPNHYTFVVLSKACGNMQDLRQGMEIHTDACKRGFTSDIFLANTLVSMYGKCGAILEAENVFSGIASLNFVSWTSMLSAYAEVGFAEQVLKLYRQMQEEGVLSDQLALGLAIDACNTITDDNTNLGLKGDSIKEAGLEIGRALHADARHNGYICDILVCNTLLTLYGKIGTLVEAENVFLAMSHHDVISWTAILSAYVQHGKSENVLLLYSWMQKFGVSLNDATILSILQACGEMGSMKVCMCIHFEVIAAGCDKLHLVATTLICTYGSCGSMLDAQAGFDDLSEPDVVSWTACIDGHASEGNAITSFNMYEKLKFEGIIPSNLTFTSLLLACSHVGYIDIGQELCLSMMAHHGIAPDGNQCGIMVDMLGRAGDFKRLENMLNRMSVEASWSTWLGLLRACHMHGNQDFAQQAFSKVVILKPKQASTYVLMSNICATARLESVGQI